MVCYQPSRYRRRARALNVGDMTNLEELEISPMEFDPNVFRTFYDEQEAQTYFNEKVSVMNSVKDNFGRKEIDYESGSHQEREYGI